MASRSRNRSASAGGRPGIEASLLGDAVCSCICFLMLQRPRRSTRVRSSAASDVYKRQGWLPWIWLAVVVATPIGEETLFRGFPVSYTHLRAHETPEHLVCRLLLEKK